MAYYILYTAANELVGVTNQAPASLPGVSVLQVEGQIPDLNKTVWNPDTLSFDFVSTILTNVEFLLRFTDAERIAFRSSTVPAVIDFLALVNIKPMINVGDAETVSGMGHLVAANIVTPTRSSEILA